MASVSTELVSRVPSKSFVAAVKTRRGTTRLICDAAQNPRDQCDTNCSRRDGLLLSLGLVGAGLLNVSDSEARTDPYYDELLSKTKLDSSDLLQKYKKINSSADSKKKGKNLPKKPTVNKNTVVLKKKPVSSAKPAAAGAGINPVEVGLGLAGVAGVVAIGQSSKKSDGGKASKVSPRSATAVKKPPVRPAPSKPATKKTLPKPAPKKAVPGTVRLSPGTKKIESKTKKVGTVAKGSRPAEKEQESGSSPAPAILVAVVALFGGLTVLGSKPEVKSTQPVSSVPQKAEKVSAKPSAPEPVQQAEKAPPVSEPAKPAPVVKSSPVSEKPAEEVKKAKLPPTTGNSPLVIIGGSVAALIAAAAVGGGSEPTSESNQGSTAASTTLDDAEARAKEAREWIEAWRKKNQKN